MDFWLNPHHGTPGLVVLPANGWHRARAALADWPDLGAVALHDRPDLAAVMGVARVAVLDDRGLWGNGAVALGGGYGSMQATLTVLGRRGAAPTALWDGDGAGVTLASVADGPHGAGVRRAASAWGALWTPDPAGGAWVSPVATPGYTELAREIMQSYRIMGEAAQQHWSGPPPTHVLVPGGVGAVAAALSVHLRPWGARLVVVEAPGDAPLLAHATGKPGPAPSLLAWQELERSAWAFSVDWTLAALQLPPSSRVLDATGRL